MPRSLFLVVAVLAASGCATVERDRALDREEMLTRAGFEKKLAETVAQRGQLQRLPARMLVRVPLGSEARYVYSDAEYCECLFAGTQEAYDQFLVALTREFINTNYSDSSTPDPVVSESEWATYEDMARRSVLDPTADASLDWSLWD
jgi:hypothetical protein